MQSQLELVGSGRQSLILFESEHINVVGPLDCPRLDSYMS
jgi:hypothetical protein